MAFLLYQMKATDQNGFQRFCVFFITPAETLKYSRRLDFGVVSHENLHSMFIRRDSDRRGAMHAGKWEKLHWYRDKTKGNTGTHWEPLRPNQWEPLRLTGNHCLTEQTE